MARGSFLTVHLLSLEGGHGGNTRRIRPQQPELLRCMVCGRVTTRADAEYRRWYCTGGHIGQWQLVVIILSVYEANIWIPLCLITIGVHNTTKVIPSPINVFTVLTWHPEGCKTSGVLRCIVLFTLLRHDSDYGYSSLRLQSMLPLT